MLKEENGTLDFFDNGERAKEAALDYLAGQMRTRWEVEQKLMKKGFPSDDIETAIQFLQEYGYVDDTNYCKSWIHDRMTFHPCGRLKMEQELAKKFSDRGLIRECLTEYFPEEMELQLAEEAALQKIGSGRKKVKKDQLMRFLTGRGYPLSVVRRALEQEAVQNYYAMEDSCDTDDFYEEETFSDGL